MNLCQPKIILLVALCILLAGCDLLPLTLPSQEPLPKPPPSPEAVVKEVVSSEASITRQFAWQYGRKRYTWTLQIPSSLYTYYREKPRPPTKDYSVYVTHPYDDQYLEMLVKIIRDTALKERFGGWETINFVVSFVQSLPYTSDSVTTGFDEYPRYPIETLVDYGGDCEDTSILMAAILHLMEYGVVLLGLPNHMAVGVLGGEGVYGTYWVHNGQKYFYLETTGTGRKIGQIPDEHKDKSAHIYEIKPTPILVIDHWEATPYGMDSYMLKVAIKNLGTATAYNAYIFAGFDASDGKVWNAKRSEPFTLAPDY